MPLGMEVGLGRRDIVLDGYPAPLPKEHSHTFSANVRCGQNGWMDYDVTWYESRPRTRRLCVRWGPSYPQKKGTPTPPNLWPMSIVTKLLDG